MTKKIKDFEEFSQMLNDNIFSYEEVNIIANREDGDFEVTDEFEFYETELYPVGTITYFIPKSIGLKWLMDGILDIYCADDFPALHPTQVFYGHNYTVDEKTDEITTYRYLCVNYFDS